MILDDDRFGTRTKTTIQPANSAMKFPSGRFNEILKISAYANKPAWLNANEMLSFVFSITSVVTDRDS
jgi:hypothetical protein